MCIWDQSQELYILEAVMPDGVRTIPFSAVMDDLGDWYDKVVLRHLEFERSDEQCELLDAFLDENVGKPYDFPVLRFAGRKKT
jgi:hypothetical protein